jgi:hypothetical protein
MNETAALHCTTAAWARKQKSNAAAAAAARDKPPPEVRHAKPRKAMRPPKGKKKTKPPTRHGLFSARILVAVQKANTAARQGMMAWD